MSNRFQIRIILAWMALAVAIILFSVTIAFSQTKSISVENENGKVHLKITKTDGNVTTKIDTTFDATSDTDVEAIIERLSNSEGDDGSTYVKYHHKKDNGKKQMHITVDSDFPEMTKEEKDKLHEQWQESMEDMRKGIDKMKESLKDIHIHIDEDSDYVKDFHFNFDSSDEDGRHENNCDGYTYGYKYSNKGESEIDSLRDKDHVIIIGGKDEKPPVLEKVIETKKGKQVFVYRRSGNSKGTSKSESSKDREKQKDKPDIRNLSYYPNPTDGKLKVNFITDKKADYTIQVLDSESKIVYSEKLNNFEGEYSKEISLVAMSKGNYFLKISGGDKTLTRKIIVN